MNIHIISNGLNKHEALLQRNIMERIPANFVKEGFSIELCIDDAIGAEESYQISGEGNIWKITGTNSLGLFHGIGKFLHTSKWTEADFQPNPPKKLMEPACTFRAIYFAVHQYNWYQMAPTEELEKYLEEMMLWGYNAIHLIIPVLNLHSFEDDLFFETVEKSRTIFKLAKNLGMKVSLGINPNQGLLSAPHEFDADPSYDATGFNRGWAGRNLCPAKPGAMEYLRNIWIKKYEQFKDIDIDYILSWPYDEGGCGCEQCRPWGARAYCDLMIAMREEAQKFFPNAKYILSAWLFDTPEDEGEWAGLYERMNGDMGFLDYVMGDSHNAFPRYPLEHDVIKPIINFPEISMWKLYPWGGYGATPLPQRFEDIWDEAKKVLGGGMPYSEGMYEDISKVQYAGYYWEPDRRWQDILAEYINYEYSGEVIDEVLEIMAGIETTHVEVAKNHEPNFNLIFRVAELAETVDKCLLDRAKNSWRWRILYIRAILDKKRFEAYRDLGMHGKEGLHNMRCFASDFIADDAEAQELIKELRRLYHCVEYNGTNQWTLPVVGGNTVLGTEGTREQIAQGKGTHHAPEFIGG